MQKMPRHSTFSAAINTSIQSELFFACDTEEKIESHDIFDLEEIRL